jgi:outer membrane protein insertion porin family
MLVAMMTIIGCARFEQSRSPLGPMAMQMGAPPDRTQSGGETVASAPASAVRNPTFSQPAGPRNPFGPSARNTLPVESFTQKEVIPAVKANSDPSPEVTIPAESNLSEPTAPPELAPVVSPLDVPRPATGSGSSAVIRGQGGDVSQNSLVPGTGEHWRYPMRASGSPILRAQYDPNAVYQPFGGPQPSPNSQESLPGTGPGGYSPLLPPEPSNPAAGIQPFNQPSVDMNVIVEEARTGKFMFGAGVNSDLGVTGQIIIDERNFDPFRFPTSWDDVINGTAWRGAGQGFRLEAMPGNQVQRYLVTHTMPYVYMPGIAEPFSVSSTGFYYTRRFFDWNEQRLGGRLQLGYRVTSDILLSGAIRAEEVTIYDPRVVGLVPQLDRVIGDNELYSGRVQLSHDTRDNAFLATQGHYFEVAYEQAFGTFDYPRGELDYRQYFLMRERPDGSGRHTLAYSFRLGFSGTDTPIYENYFSGGYSTMRGFDFRGASPMGPGNVAIGGQFRFLGSVEYFFPLTADDMIKGVVFCDYGTTEEEIELNSDNYRVAPGFGLRLNIPAMGPAPLALDFAVPVTRAPTDNIQNFSFFFGFSR